VCVFFFVGFVVLFSGLEHLPFLLKPPPPGKTPRQVDDGVLLKLSIEAPIYVKPLDLFFLSLCFARLLILESPPPVRENFETPSHPRAAARFLLTKQFFFRLSNS